jgi:hypothetical protein
MFRLLELSNDSILAFEVQGTIDKKDYDKIKPLLQEKEKAHGKVRLFIEIGDVENIEPRAFLEDIAMYFKHVKHIEKIAIVGLQDAARYLPLDIDPFNSLEVKYFNKNEIKQAQTWIKQ